MTPMTGELKRRWAKPGEKAVLLTNGVLLVLLAFFARTTVYSSDDYWYSTFWDQGLMHYLELMAYHYQAVNGRVLVHVLAHIVLHFDSWAFVAMCCGLCVLGSWIVASASGESPERYRVVLCVVLIGIFCMPLGIFNQGLMWISASCNYFFPVILACVLAVLLERQSRWAVLFAFLCGATTEQMGLAAAVLCAVHMVRRVRHRKGSLCGALCLTMSLAGVFTIFSSPATQMRAENSVKWNTLAEYFQILFKSFLREVALLTENPATVLLMLLVLLLGALQLWRKDGLKWPAVTAALGGAALILESLGFGDICGWGFLCGFLTLAVLSVALMGRGYGIAGSLILTSLAAAAVMLPTSTIAYRVMLPFYLLLLLACSSLIALQIRKMERFGLFSVAALFAVLAVTAPTVRGYLYNHRIDEVNKSHVQEDMEKSFVHYCTDYDRDYTWIKADYDPKFQSLYLESVGLSASLPVRFYSQHVQSNPIRYGEAELTGLAVTQDDGHILLPLREIVEAVGGTLDWQMSHMIVEIQGRKYQLLVPDDDTILVSWTDETGTAQELSGSRDLRYWITYCDLAVFTQAFGFRIHLDVQTGCYVLEP